MGVQEGILWPAWSVCCDLREHRGRPRLDPPTTASAMCREDRDSGSCGAGGAGDSSAGLQGTQGRKKSLNEPPPLWLGAEAAGAPAGEPCGPWDSPSTCEGTAVGSPGHDVCSFENIARTWLTRELPLCHQTQGSLGVSRSRAGLYAVCADGERA